MTPEKYIQNQIRLYCGENNILCFRCNVGTVRLSDGSYFDTGLPSGFSDLLILPGNGKLIFCEVKSESGKQRADQIEFQKTVESRGYTYIIARDVKTVVEAIKKAS